MTYTKKHFPEIVSSAMAILDVLKKIAEHYLTDNIEDILYDPLEYSIFIDFLIKENAATILATFKTPTATYFHPSPFRPEISAVFHAKCEFVKTLKRYTTINNDQSKDIIIPAEDFFMNALVTAIKSDDIDLTLLKNIEDLDDVFTMLNGLLRVALIKQLNHASQNTTIPAAPTPRDVPLKLSVESSIVYDSDLDEEVIDVYSDPMTPKLYYQPLSPTSLHYGLFTPVMSELSKRPSNLSQINSDDESCDDHPCFKHVPSVDGCK